MKKRNAAVFTLAIAAFVVPAFSQEQIRRASLRNIGGDWGKCTIEVDVDDVAEVAISGDTGRLRTLGGAPAIWRRFECSGPIPARPGDFRFRGIDGRGRVELIRDPRSNRGVAVVRIDDSDRGREGYTFDLEWRGDAGYGGGGYRGGDGYPGGRRDGGGEGMAEALRNCQEAVTDRLNRDGYGNVRFRSASADDRRGRDDLIAGFVSARRGGRGNDDFEYACSVDLRSGRIRDVNLRRR
jgi:hypothetical protein